MSIVQSLWIGTNLSTLERLSIQSFLAHGHQYHLYAYDEFEVPKGAVIRDASAILPRESIFTYASGFGQGSHSAFSNLFRYALIREHGGWWVDTDVVCLKRFDFDEEFVFATEREDDGSTLAASCVFKSPRNSEYLDYCLRVCHAKNKQELQWSEIGPYLFDEAIRQFELTKYFVPIDVFNAIDYFSIDEITKSGFDRSRLTNAYAVHLWNQMWKSRNMDPEQHAHPDSVYAVLKRQYL